MKINQILSAAFQKLDQNNIPNPHLDAEILLSFILGKNREFLLTYPEKKLNKKQIQKFNNLIQKRLKNEAIAYLIGYKYFYGLKFKVNKNVLTPRPETELMVEQAIKTAKKLKKFTIIDIGTGSGCIAISVAKNLKFKNSKIFAVDISKPALNVARQNARCHKVDKKIKFLQGDLLTYFLSKKPPIFNRGLIILANLPYLSPEQIKNSPSIQKEPKNALVAGKDGLKYYRQLLKQIQNLSPRLNSPCYILLEIDPSQAKNIKILIEKNLPKTKIKIKKDLAGLNRLVIISIQ